MYGLMRRIRGVRCRWSGIDGGRPRKMREKPLTSLIDAIHILQSP